MARSVERVAAFRDVLRHLNHPERLSKNLLVAAQFHLGGDPLSAAARIEHLVESALDDLPVRQREIIRRCDLRGTPHRQVMAQLGVSERHFYRERMSAFEVVSAALADKAQATEPADSTANVSTLLLNFADAAHQVGDLGRALSVVRDAMAHARNTDERIHLECRSVELCCEAGTVATAKQHIQTARELSATLQPHSSLIDARIDAAESLMAWRSGDTRLGVQQSERSITTLRSEIHRRSAPSAAEALALALIVSSEHELCNGRLVAARRKAIEARDAIIAADSGRAALRVRAESAATVVYMFDPAHFRDAASELERQYHDSLARGLTLEATLVGWRLSAFHRFAGAPRRAVEALCEILPIARQVLTGDERAGFCLDLASHYVASGQPDMAHTMIAQAQVHAVADGYAYAHSYTVAAEAFLAQHAFAQALRLSSEAIAAMERVGRQTSKGSALRIAADAHHALGDNRTAKHSIAAALRELEGVGHPVVLIKAHRSAARITGKPNHRRIAKELSALLKHGS